MKQRSMSYAAIAAVTLSFSMLAAPLAAFAQSSAAAAPAGTTAPAPAAAMPKSMSVQVEQHIMLLRGKLGITQAEDPQWEQFANVMRDHATDMEQALASRATPTKLSAVDSMNSYAQLAQLHADNMHKLNSAFKALYDSFPAKQKALADGVFQQHDERPAADKQAADKPATD